MSDNSNTGLTFGVDANVHNSFGVGQGQSLLLQKDFAGLSSQQLLNLAGEGVIEAWQNKTDPTQALVYGLASIFGTNFEANAQIAFGEKFDIQKAKAFGADILGGNYGVLPDFQFIDSTEINGGYAQSLNTVFFDNLFVSQNAANPNAVGKVLVQELAHRIDAFASPVDSMGDEGKILAKLVNGEKLSSAELTSLKTEDDHKVINIGGQQVAVEMDAVSVTANTLQTAKNIGVLGSTSQTFTGFVGDSGIHNYIKFQVTTPSTFAVELSGLIKDANVRLLNDQGGFIQASYNKSTAIDAFKYQLGVGTYYVHVYREAAGDNTNYSLKISAPPVTPVTNTLPIVPVGSTPISTAPPSVAPNSNNPLGTIDLAGDTRATAKNLGTLTTSSVTFSDRIGKGDKDDFISFYVAEPLKASIEIKPINVVSAGTIGLKLFYPSDVSNPYNSSGFYSTNTFSQDYIFNQVGWYYLQLSDTNNVVDAGYTLSVKTNSFVSDIGTLNGNLNAVGNNNNSLYRFKVDQNSIVKASTNLPNAIELRVKDSNYNDIGLRPDVGTTLKAGTYYLSTSPIYDPVTYKPYTIPSSFALNLQSTPTVRYDNAGFNYSSALDLGTITGTKSATDYIDRTDKLDYYTFMVGSKSSVSLNVAAISGSPTVGVQLLNDKYSPIGYSAGNAGAAPQPLTATLEAGKYYVLINDITGTTDVQYRLDVNAQSLVANDAIGNSLSQSKDLGYLVPNTPITLKDAIGGTDPADWMKFNVSTLGNVSTAFSGLTTPITLQLSRIEANGSLISISSQNSNGQANWTPLFSNLVGNYALVVSSSNSTSTPYTLNLSTVSTNVAPTNVKWNFSGTYQSNQDVIVTGTVSDANGALDIDEAKFYLQSKDGSFRQTFTTKNFTQSATDSKVANFSINLGKLPVGQYVYQSDVYDKSRTPANTGTTIYLNGGYAAEVVYKAVNSGFQVASEILPYYSALSSVQQNKLGSPISANATNTNGTWRQDFQGGWIIAWSGSTPTVSFNDGTLFELPSSLIKPLPTVGTLYSTGNVSGSLSSSDAKDQFRSAFYDDYGLSGFTAGQQARLTLTGSGFTPQIFLIDAVSGQTLQQSTVIQNGNQTILDFVVPTTGNYRVRVTSGNANQTGSYNLASGSIPVNPPVSSGSTGSTTTSYRITEPVDEAKEWKASLFSWNRNSGSTPPANFYDGGSNNPNWIGTLNLGSNNAKGNVSGSAKLDWGTGTVKGNSQLPADGFAIRAYTWADFDGSDYKFTVRGDDGYQILAKKQGTGEWFYITPKDQWQTQGYGVQSQFSFKLPAGRYDLHFHYFEHGGEAKMDLSWNKGTASNPVTGVLITEQVPMIGTGKLISATNFRTSPSVSSSTLSSVQGAGTEFTFLEKVTTNDSNLDLRQWYHVRLSNGQDGYFWAKNVVGNVKYNVSVDGAINSLSGDSGIKFNNTVAYLNGQTLSSYFEEAGKTTTLPQQVSKQQLQGEIQQLQQQIQKIDSGINSLDKILKQLQQEVQAGQTESKQKKSSWNPFDWVAAELIDYKVQELSTDITLLESFRNSATNNKEVLMGNLNDLNKQLSFLNSSPVIEISNDLVFKNALAFTLPKEGGYVNDKDDKGGATNQGITQTTYNSYLDSLKLPRKDVKLITSSEVETIYYKNYWLKSGSDKLSEKLAIVNFDASVNHGLDNSKWMLKEAKSSAQSSQEIDIVRKYLDIREDFYRTIVENNPKQQKFLKGWLNRIADLRKTVSA